ncbi:hypothetical protein FPZ12_030675 [Amycolatopsis acidicola]|uniref:CopG family transcriptional regulator n=1 Tax=Amycolatopsis acidicola TaxID=2596893 RepID=A0A5N0UX12_9PSEU|nr:hypothetical protein [Amycolatopsis acidicola]KAA9155029.1 hypothetical protein FPZ12_030675 [Amycolatopsis acidicola]
MELPLPEDLEAQVLARAEDAGLPVGEWIVAALQREAFRQLCEKTDDWWRHHPDEARAATEDYEYRHRGSSAA